MADSLSLLRKFTIEDKHVEAKDGQIIFDDLSWDKDSLTNWSISYGKHLEKVMKKEYYSLGSLVYLLRYEHLKHPDYVNQAAEDKIMAVRRPDRGPLLKYLHGKETQHPKNIDETVHLDKPIHVKRSAEEDIDNDVPVSKRVKNECTEEEPKG